METNDKFALGRRSVIAGGALAGAGLLAGFGMGREMSAAKAAPMAKPVQSLTPGASQLPVAFIMDDGATMIDFAGPWEVFQDTGFAANVPGFSLFTVASGAGPFETTGNLISAEPMRMTGLKFTPDYTFDNAPQPKVVIMGAQGGGRNPKKLDWIRSVASQADVVMSVCTGAFLLASTGLLDGLKATTHHNFYDQFATRFPKIELIRGRRFVDNGKLITAGGLSSGIDTALHVVNRYYGADAAQKVADNMEYQGAGWRA
jgi:transcriptional regulator GlxA family with amidase domain